MQMRANVLLSIQRALLGMVTPDLRAVEVWISDRSVTARFAYDSALRDEHRDAVSEIETLVIADLPDDVRIGFEAASVPYPEPVALVRDSAFVYLRAE